MTLPELHTPRLTLRAITTGDAAFMLELLNSEGWLKNIGDRGVRTLSEAVQFIEGRMFKMYEEHGIGSYVVVRKEDNIPVGTSGLIHRDFLEHADIGYAFLPQYTGMGYAIEAALEVKRHAFEDREQPKLYAFCLPSNRPSVRVLEKLGMVYEGEIVQPGETEILHLYAVKRD